MTALSRWLEAAPRHRRGLRAFQVCLALAVLFRVLTEARHAAWLYGPTGVGAGSSTVVLGEAGAWLDALYGLAAAPYLLLALEAGGAWLLLRGRRTRLGAALTLVPMLLLEWRTPEIADGGDNLARLALCYMLLALPADAPEPPRGSARTYLHNLGIVLLGGQLFVVYFTAGMAKASGPAWVNGTALYLVSQVDEYSLPGLQALFENAWVCVGATYATVVWQVLFPVGVLSRTRLAFVAVGFFFHVGVAVFMGLLTFSLIMVGAELMLLTDAEWRAIERRCARAVRSLRRGRLVLRASSERGASAE